MPGKSSRLVTAALVGAAAVVATAGAATPASAAATSWPARYSAPYVDVSLYPTFDLAAAASATGEKHYLLAFILNVGDSCTAGWSSYEKLDSGFLQSGVAALRAAGGDVGISVGGANGSEPASSCTTPEALQAQYQRVVDAYQLSRIDFDVEGAAIADTATVDRRNKAIAGLQAANPGLLVSYTLPVLPSGLTQDGVNLLQNAAGNGVRLDLVTIMAMDYGAPDGDMGGAATSAATAVMNQLRTVLPGESESALYGRLGITPMVGQNDSQGEVFSAADADTVLAFARAHGLRQVSFWSAGRDNGGCAGQTWASPTCSGVAQDQWAFTRQFGAFDGAAA